MKWITFMLSVWLWCAAGCAWLRPPEPTGFGGSAGGSGVGDYMQAQGRAPGTNVPVSPNWSDYRPRGGR